MYGVHCCPHNRQLFLSCGADGGLRLWHVLRSQPLLALEPSSKYLTAVRWSPSRPAVFAAAAGDGRVYFYDLARSGGGNGGGLVRPVLALDAAESGRPVHALAFSGRVPTAFATSDGQTVRVWRLPAHLAGTGSEGASGAAAVKREAALLARLAEADSDTAGL